MGGGYNANGHPYVDLGLPSRTLWATMNVGATSESEKGDFFMWGSTTPNTDTPCDWEHTPFNGGYAEYNADAFDLVKDTVCPNGVLAKKYDAAAQIMGGDWRMPTEAEVQELIDNTTKEWTQVNSAYGYKFTSNTDESKYIFIPASVYRVGSSFTNSGYGAIWSSSLNTSDPSAAWRLNFDYYGGVEATNHFSRYYGFNVRGVL